MPHFETSRFQTGTRVTFASELVYIQIVYLHVGKNTNEGRIVVKTFSNVKDKEIVFLKLISTVLPSKYES